MNDKQIIVLESHLVCSTLQGVYGVMHELVNKTECYDTYIFNIEYNLMVGVHISSLGIMPLFIWETYKNTNWEDVYLDINDKSNEYKEWLKKYNRKQKIKKLLDNE